MEIQELRVADPLQEPPTLLGPGLLAEPSEVLRRRKIAAICAFTLIPVSVLLAIGAVILLASLGSGAAGGCGGG